MYENNVKQVWYNNLEVHNLQFNLFDDFPENRTIIFGIDSLRQVFILTFQNQLKIPH